MAIVSQGERVTGHRRSGLAGWLVLQVAASQSDMLTTKRPRGRQISPVAGLWPVAFGRAHTVCVCVVTKEDNHE
uniref:Putative secreted protein n=1 Tax=Anopheles darlingi TaxID=43151 RepID=A0A2M4D653_ANODA